MPFGWAPLNLECSTPTVKHEVSEKLVLHPASLLVKAQPWRPLSEWFSGLKEGFMAESPPAWVSGLCAQKALQVVLLRPSAPEYDCASGDR